MLVFLHQAFNYVGSMPENEKEDSQSCLKGLLHLRAADLNAPNFNE